MDNFLSHVFEGDATTIVIVLIVAFIISFIQLKMTSKNG